MTPGIGIGLGVWNVQPPSRFAYTTTEASDWVARQLVQPNYEQGRLLNTLVAAIKPDAFDVGDQCYLFGIPHHEQAAMVNMLQNRFDGFLVNGQQIVLNRGLSGDGASTFSDLVMTVAAGSLKHAQNDAGLIYGVLTSSANGAAASVDVGIGSMFARRNAGDKSISIRAHSSATDTGFSAAQGVEPLIIGMSRESSTVLKTYKRGTGLVNTFATASTTPNTESFRAGMAGFAGFGLNQLFFMLVGKSFTLAQFNVIADGFYNYAHDPAVGAM